MVSKLMLDFDDVDLNELTDLCLEFKFDIFMTEDLLYIHQDYNNQRTIPMLMEKMKIVNYFVQPIKKEPEGKTGDIVNEWVKGKMQKDSLDEFEYQHQQELNQMLDNIERVRRDLVTEQQNKKEGEDGRTKSTRKTRSRATEKNTR